MNLLQYTDYRAYLKDYYRKQKNKNRSFSYKTFANRAKLASPNYLKLVIDGSRRITDKNISNFIRGLKLNNIESKYFKNLVFYQESKDTDAKQNYLITLNHIRNKVTKAAQIINEQNLDVLKNWYNWAIRELVVVDDFSDDPKWISKKLKNLISPTEAKSSLELLLKLGFIENRNGKYFQKEPLITTSDEIPSKLIRNIHRQFIDLSKTSISVDPIDSREFSSVTMAISKNKIPMIKGAIKEFRKELNRIFSDSENNDDVYHLLISFFPITAGGTK